MPITRLTITTSLISITLIVLQFFQKPLVFLHSQIHNGEIWRLWTGNLVHSNIYHLGLNLAGLWLFYFLYKEFINSTQLLISLAILMTGVSVGLYVLMPQLEWYAGISGALYGLYLVGAFYALLQHDYLSSLPVLLVIPGKIIWDYLHNSGQQNAELIGVPVSIESHIYGISSALIIILILALKHYKTFKYNP